MSVIFQVKESSMMNLLQEEASLFKKPHKEKLGSTSHQLHIASRDSSPASVSQLKE